MLFLLIIALSLGITTNPSLLKNTSALSETYQQKCLGHVPMKEDVTVSMRSLLCGEKITDASLKENLSKSSLIHIFIVSGSHLLLVDQVLSIMRIPVFLRFLALGFYSLLVGWQAPAVRALGSVLMRAGLQHSRIYFPGDLVVLACGLLMLSLFPEWWQSMSFQMSWCAALALTAPRVFGVAERSWRGALYAQLFIFVVMLPVLWGWGSLHPVGILCNLLLAPVVALILLPLSFLALFHRIFLSMFTVAMQIFDRLLAAVAEPVELPHQPPLAVEYLWLWILLLQVILHFARLYFRQGKDRR